METTPDVPWPRVTFFVRQLTHDVRNHLNGLDLEASLLTELITDSEASASLARIRRQVREIAAELRSLSARLAPSAGTPAAIAARDAFAIWKDQALTLEPAPRVQWTEALGEERIHVEVEALARTFRELLSNAAQFGTGAPLHASATAGDGRVVFTLSEPKAAPVDPSEWGRAPLVSTRGGHYGLGLWVAQRDVAASGGTIERAYDAATQTLTTSITFPAV